MATRIPPSLNATNFTKTPFYLYLYGADTAGPNKWRGWTRQQVISKGTCYILPLPERALGANTEIKAQDEESVARYPSTAGILVGGTQKGINAISGSIPLLGPLMSSGFEMLKGHGMGGAGVPLDFTAMTVYGNKKRTFRFIIDLYGINPTDTQTIAKFCRKVHGLSMVRPGTAFLKTPHVWTVAIFDNNGNDVTANWLPDPGACVMQSVSHTPSPFIYTLDGSSPGRSIISMTMVEIEPMSYDGAFKPTWANAPDVAWPQALGLPSTTEMLRGGLFPGISKVATGGLDALSGQGGVGGAIQSLFGGGGLDEL